MSGGAYDYLFTADHILSRTEHLEAMVNDCKNLSSYDTANLSVLQKVSLRTCIMELEDIAKAARKLEDRLQELKPVLRAIEWWQSGDSSAESVVKVWEESAADICKAEHLSNKKETGQ